MSVAKLLVAAFPALVLALSARAEEDPWKKDHPLISRYPGSEPMGSPGKYREFDEYELVLGKVKSGDTATAGKTQHLEGKIYTVTYRNPEGRSALEIYRNYESALTRSGFKLIYSCKDAACGDAGKPNAELQFYDPGSVRRYLVARLERPQGDAYVAILIQAQDPTSTGETALNVIEVKPIQLGLVAVDAAALGDDIARTGHAAVYGILFDTDKAVVKPESDAALKEVAKLLQQDAALKLHVVGHTDNQGSVAHNIDLSTQRAQAVLAALTTRYKIAGARLDAQGVGPYAPVASNDDEDGRARNRRVELVKQ